MFEPGKIQIQRLRSLLWKNVECNVLRLDQLHPIVSGNKWFKLKYYLQNAKELNKDVIATFGGAYSNHIAATAFACQQTGLKSIGFIRGEKATQPSDTLIEAMNYGMELVYISRDDYQDKKQIIADHSNNTWYWINEGGYGIIGMNGAKDILSITDTSPYSHIICSCGTGTTLAGLTAAALPHQTCIGISALKGYANLAEDVVELLPEKHHSKSFKVFHEYHFGGYAKHPPPLIEWMNELWEAEQLPTDIIYTSKMMFAIKDLIDKEYFSNNNKLLIVHSGGLQGNRSLPKNTLAFL